MKLLKHLSFWVAIILVLTMILAYSYGSYWEPFCFAIMLLPVIALTSYFFNYYLVPNFLLTKRLFRFILYSVYMLIISLHLEMVVVTLAFIWLANYHYDRMIPFTSNAPVLAIILYCIVFLYGFALLARKSWRNQQTIQAWEDEQEKQRNAFLHVRADRKINTIPQGDIEYLESLGDYVKIMTTSSQPIITKEKISALEKKLPATFLRIHRSYIVNLAKVSAYTKEQVHINNVSLPISRTYKERVLNNLSK